ncbi:MAG: hypothetical protein FJ388_15375 [Verrucomicrobia bacterium]|nr:hypothetical protein [Verrucomicrobiota bacterium]
MSETIPTLHIEAESIPQAHYRAMKAVLERGIEIRTQYDKKDATGRYLDPASRDAAVLVCVKDPFAQPRYPVASCCEIGAYIAEILGVKDHLVVPFARLKKELSSGAHLSAKEWPYTYHQRLFDYPLADGTSVNQIETTVERLAESLITRRAVATTRVPEIDCFLKDDQPCLGEVQLRCTEQNGAIYLHMNTRWRSRDLFKAWGDNVVGLTFMQQVLARQLGRRMQRDVRVGSYTDFSFSLHVYGQDIKAGGSMGLAAGQYVAMGEEAVVKRAMPSDMAKELLVLPQLEELLTPAKIAEWSFGEKQVAQIKELIEDIGAGRLMA